MRRLSTREVYAKVVCTIWWRANGPLVVVQRYPAGVPYAVSNPTNNEERQLPRTNFKLLDLPSDYEVQQLPPLQIDGLVVVGHHTPVAGNSGEQTAKNGRTAGEESWLEDFLVPGGTALTVE